MESQTRPIYIISGGAGALGKHIARIALSQFPSVKPQVKVIPQIREPHQLAEALGQAAEREAVILHTLVDPAMRAALEAGAAERGLIALDTIGGFLDRLSDVFGQPPLGQPGLYQGAHNSYLERIQAIEYTVDHDDGRNTHELDQADVVLTGVSRVGKTPLSIYLSVLGWKVANVPLVVGIDPPPQLFTVDRRRVVGLLVEPETLVHHRHWRQQSLAGMGGQVYSAYDSVAEEIDFARKIFRRGGFSIVNTTNRPIEESADHIIALISRYFEHTVRSLH